MGFPSRKEERGRSPSYQATTAPTILDERFPKKTAKFVRSPWIQCDPFGRIREPGRDIGDAPGEIFPTLRRL
jgi:hypothetical protein